MNGKSGTGRMALCRQLLCFQSGICRLKQSTWKLYYTQLFFTLCNCASDIMVNFKRDYTTHYVVVIFTTRWQKPYCIVWELKKMFGLIILCLCFLYVEDQSWKYAFLTHHIFNCLSVFSMGYSNVSHLISFAVFYVLPEIQILRLWRPISSILMGQRWNTSLSSTWWTATQTLSTGTRFSRTVSQEWWVFKIFHHINPKATQDALQKH